MIAMRLTVIGCSGSYPGPDSRASCYLVEADDADGRTWRILLDLGSGALGALQRFADPLAIDAVFISHLHADHCLDLCGYHVLRRYHPDGPQPRIPVWGPVGTARADGRRRTACPTAIGMNDEFDFYEHGGPVELGPVRGRARARQHPVPAFGLRVRPAAAPSPTPATPGRAPGSTSSPTAPTCCSPRRRSSPARTTRRTSTSPAPTAAWPPRVVASAGSW